MPETSTAIQPNETHHENFSLSPRTSLGIVTLVAGGGIAYILLKGFSNIFNGPGRFGQGKASYENQEKLNSEIARLSTEINTKELTKDNIAYKTAAQALYQIMNNQMFLVDFGVITKFIYFRDVVDKLQGFNAEELKQIVVEFGTRPRSYIFEFGASGSLFDWFERMFTVEQIKILSGIFANTNLWRIHEYPFLRLFEQDKDKENAVRWSPWISVSSESRYAYPIAGTNKKVYSYDPTTAKVLDKFIPLNYLIGFKVVGISSDSFKPLGASYLKIMVGANIITEKGVNLNGKTIWVDSRYFNSAPPTEQWKDKYLIRTK